MRRASSRRADATSASSRRTARHATIGDGSIKSGTWYIGVVADGCWSTSPMRRAMAGRPELDDGQGLRPMARDGADHRRAPIDRYGAEALGFTWSIFNEPDLGPLFWRTDWDELQRYYDYTTDAVLRAFEDRGYDSDRVFIGGLRARRDFRHPSEAGGVSRPLLAAGHGQRGLAAERRGGRSALAGKRSRRVETLCRDHGGKGSPCNFVSIHSYDRSEMMAAKLIRAKEAALAIDPGYPGRLGQFARVVSQLVPAARRSGRRQLPGRRLLLHLVRRCDRPPASAGGEEPRVCLRRDVLDGLAAAAESRRGECRDARAAVRAGRARRKRPAGHGARADLPRAGAVVRHGRSLLAAASAATGRPRGGRLRRARRPRRCAGCAYRHHPQDTQSRSETAFDIGLAIDHLGWDGPARVEEHRFDKDHNSYFRELRDLRDRAAMPGQTMRWPQRGHSRRQRQSGFATWPNAAHRGYDPPAANRRPIAAHGPRGRQRAEPVGDSARSVQKAKISVRPTRTPRRSCGPRPGHIRGPGRIPWGCGDAPASRALRPAVPRPVSNKWHSPTLPCQG